MRRFIAIVIVGVLIYFSYQWYEQSRLESEPAFIETIATSIKEAVQAGGAMLKDELDSIEQRLAAEEASSATDSVDGLAAEGSGLEIGQNKDYIFESDQTSEEQDKSSSGKADHAKLTTADEQGIVQFLAEQFDEHSPELTFRIEGSYRDVSDNLTDWLKQALEINEYARYAMASYSYTVSNKLLYNEVELKANFRESKEMTEQVRNFAKSLLTEMKLSQYSKEQQVKLIHDWIVTNVQYDESLQRYTAYEALKEGLAVCQGYAMLGYMLYSEAGFDVRIVEGTAKGQEHAWNMILLNDRWYQLDLTWDDPVGQAADEVSYRYYLVSDEELARDHVWKGDYPVAPISYKQTLLEAASKLEKSSSQYKQLQELRQELGFHWYDEQNQINSYDKLHALLKQAVSKRQDSVQFVYADGSKAENDIVKALRSLKTARSYQMSYYEFSEQGDMAITLTLTY